LPQRRSAPEPGRSQGTPSRTPANRFEQTVRIERLAKEIDARVPDQLGEIVARRVAAREDDGQRGPRLSNLGDDLTA